MPRRKTDREAPLEILGSTALQCFNGQIREHYLQDLNGLKGVRVKNEMRDSEPIIGSWHKAFTYLLVGIQWKSVPAEGGGPRAAGAAKLLDEILGDMEHTWSDFMYEAAMTPIFGYGLFEKCYKIRGGDSSDKRYASKYDDKAVGLRRLGYRPPESIEQWEMDSEGCVTGAIQALLPFQKRVRLPLKKLVHLRTDVIKDNPEGRSWLVNCYDPWYRLRHLRNFENIFCEKMGGIPIIKLPFHYLQETDDPQILAVRAYAERVIQGFRIDEQMGLVFPGGGQSEGFDFQLVFPQGNFDFNTPIRRNEIMISMALHSEMLFRGILPVGTSIGKVDIDLIGLSINTFAKQIEVAINKHLVRPLMTINGYLPDEIPYYTAGTIQKVDLKAVVDYLVPLMRHQAVFPTKELEEKLIGLVNQAQGTELPTNGPEEDEVGLSRSNKAAMSQGQFAELRTMQELVAQGGIPRDSAIAALVRGFNMTPEDADAILGEIGESFIPAVTADGLPTGEGPGQEEAQEIADKKAEQALAAAQVAAQNAPSAPGAPAKPGTKGKTGRPQTRTATDTLNIDQERKQAQRQFDKNTNDNRDQ